MLGPWIHVASKVDHFAAVRVGDELTVRAKVTANYEKKGHRFVELDGLVVANATTPIARIAHTAIYRPRAVAYAARRCDPLSPFLRGEGQGEGQKLAPIVCAALTQPHALSCGFHNTRADARLGLDDGVMT